MANTEQTFFTTARVGANGRLTIPTKYRRAFARPGAVSVLLIPVGDALVIAPSDDAFTDACQRLEAQMDRAGSSVEELIAAAAEARTEMARDEFGAGDE